MNLSDNWRTCADCSRAKARQAGAKCARHGSTGTTVQTASAATGYRPGVLGPFRAMLCGYDPRRTAT